MWATTNGRDQLDPDHNDRPDDYLMWLPYSGKNFGFPFVSPLANELPVAVLPSHVCTSVPPQLSLQVSAYWLFHQCLHGGSVTAILLLYPECCDNMTLLCMAPCLQQCCAFLCCKALTPSGHAVPLHWRRRPARP